jgi:hypothetical protein
VRAVEVEAMSFYWLTLSILAVWRVTHFLSSEDGPWDLSVRLRRHAGEGFWGRLLDCFYCLSLWVAAPFAAVLGESVGHIVFLWLALSAGASLLERITQSRQAELPAAWVEHREESSDMLRKETRPVAEHRPE